MKKETWDELQQTFLMFLVFGCWITFEYWCYKNPQYSALPHTTAVRLVLTNCVTGLFTYIYTKSMPSDRNGGNRGDKKNEQ